MLLLLANRLNTLIQPLNKLSFKFSAIMSMLMVAVIASNVFARYFMNYSFASAEELARYMMIGFTFLLFPITQNRGQNVSVDFAVSSFRYTGMGMFLAVCTELVIILVLGFCLKYSLSYVERSWNVISPALQIPMGTVFAVLPYSFALSIVCCLERVLRFSHYLLHVKTIDDLRQHETTCRGAI